MGSTVDRRDQRGDIKGNANAGQKLQPEINVTPLVDVVLVLLIIFMVISPQLEVGDRVDLPVAESVAKGNELNVLTVTLTNSNKLMLENDEVTREDLLAKLQYVLELDPTKKLALKADRGVAYGKVRELFAQAQTVGFRGIALLVQDADGKRQK